MSDRGNGLPRTILPIPAGVPTFVRSMGRFLFPRTIPVLLLMSVFLVSGCAGRRAEEGTDDRKLHDVAPAGPFQVNAKQPSAPTQVTGNQIAQIDAEISGTKPHTRDPADLGRLLPRMAQAADPKERRALIGEYLELAWELDPAKRASALKDLERALAGKW